MSDSVQSLTKTPRFGKGTWMFLAAVITAFVVAMAVMLAGAAPASANEAVTDVVAGSTPATAAGSLAPATPQTTLVAEETSLSTSVSAGPSVDYSAIEIEFVQLANEYRKDNGLEPLLLSDILTVACERHSADMATYGFMDHLTGYRDTANGGLVPMKGKSSDYFDTGTNPAERMIACGYDFATTMGENLAAGYDTAAGALDGFKASPTHNEILLSADFKVMGIAFVYKSGSDYGYYWTTDFGGHVDTTAHASVTSVVSVD